MPLFSKNHLTNEIQRQHSPTMSMKSLQYQHRIIIGNAHLEEPLHRQGFHYYWGSQSNIISNLQNPLVDNERTS